MSMAINTTITILMQSIRVFLSNINRVLISIILREGIRIPSKSNTIRGIT